MRLCHAHAYEVDLTSPRSVSMMFSSFFFNTGEAATRDHVGSSVQAPWPTRGLPPVGGNSGHPRSQRLPHVYEQPGSQQPDLQLE